MLFLVKGNLFAQKNTFLFGIKDIIKKINTNTNEEKNNCLLKNDYDLKVYRNYDENIQNDKKFSKNFDKENYRDKFAHKDTSKIISLIDVDKFKQKNYLGNSVKINNMMSPFDHREYSPISKDYNLVKDAFKSHSEQVLKLKHLERGDTKKF